MTLKEFHPLRMLALCVGAVILALGTPSCSSSEKSTSEQPVPKTTAAPSETVTLKVPAEKQQAPAARPTDETTSAAVPAGRAEPFSEETVDALEKGLKPLKALPTADKSP